MSPQTAGSLTLLFTYIYFTMLKLTARQEQILNLIKEAIDNTGFPPTRAEIAKELGFRSANAAEEHLQALARKGAIEISPGTRAASAWSAPLTTLRRCQASRQPC